MHTTPVRRLLGMVSAARQMTISAMAVTTSKKQAPGVRTGPKMLVESNAVGLESNKLVGER